MTQKLAIIGAGMASGRMLEELIELVSDAFEITLFGAELQGNYNRIMLSPVLAGEKTYDEIITHNADWYSRNKVNCRFGEAVVKIDRKQKRVISAEGVTHYDKLVIATGSASFFIPVAGDNLPGVIGFRDYGDVEKMLEAARKAAGKAVIIGGLGIKLEKLLWGSWTPHKVKLAVSGCSRNCAEATCKDVGIICVDSGYEVSVAGAAGMELKETQALAKTDTEREAIDLTVAFIQLYREHARYLDRPHKWLAKVGLDWVKERVVDNLDKRAALCERFESSQSVYRNDPWAEQATPEYKQAKWSPLADLILEAAQ